MNKDEIIESTTIERDPPAPTCETCRFCNKVREGYNRCMVMQPHFVSENEKGVKKIDGVEVSPNRPACMHHPAARGNSTSDQFLKLLQAQLGIAGMEAQGAAQMRSMFMGHEDK